VSTSAGWARSGGRFSAIARAAKARRDSADHRPATSAAQGARSGTAGTRTRGRPEEGERRERRAGGPEPQGTVLRAAKAPVDPGRGEDESGEEEEEPAVRPDEEPPDPVEDRVREAFSGVAREGAAEAVELEAEPRREGKGRAGRPGEEAPGPEAGDGREGKEEEGRDRREARLQEEGASRKEARAESPPARRRTVLGS
jgi:hypothetical protein